MSGVMIVGELLRADAALTAIVPAARIKAGRLPEDAPLPTLVIRSVSLVDWEPLKGGPVHSVERVSVTVRAANDRDRRALIGLVRRCCAGRTGDIGDARGVSIRTAGAGPDVDGPGNSFERAQDFRVGFKTFD